MVVFLKKIPMVGLSILFDEMKMPEPAVVAAIERTRTTTMGCRRRSPKSGDGGQVALLRRRPQKALCVTRPRFDSWDHPGILLFSFLTSVLFFFHGNETGDPPTTRRARAGDRLIFNFEVQCLLCALLNDDDSELWGYEHVVFAESTGDATIHVENVGERVIFQGWSSKNTLCWFL